MLTNDTGSFEQLGPGEVSKNCWMNRKQVLIKHHIMEKRERRTSTWEVLFVFMLEVLWPSQPNGVMSSVVCLPNYTFTGQA